MIICFLSTFIILFFRKSGKGEDLLCCRVEKRRKVEEVWKRREWKGTSVGTWVRSWRIVWLIVVYARLSHEQHWEALERSAYYGALYAAVLVNSIRRWMLFNAIRRSVSFTQWTKTPETARRVHELIVCDLFFRFLFGFLCVSLGRCASLFEILLIPKPALSLSLWEWICCRYDASIQKRAQAASLSGIL